MQMPFEFETWHSLRWYEPEVWPAHDIRGADEHVELVRVGPAPAIEQPAEGEDDGPLDVGVPPVVQQELGVLPGADALAQCHPVLRAEVGADIAIDGVVEHVRHGRQRKEHVGLAEGLVAGVGVREAVGVVWLHIAHEGIVDHADPEVGLDAAEAAEGYHAVPGRTGSRVAGY